MRERAPVVAIQSGGTTVAAARDGLVLRGLRARGLPTLRVRSVPGERVTDRRTLGALGVAAGAPPELRDRIVRLWSGPRGLTLDLRNGPDLIFGSGTDPARKWIAAVRVLADPSSAGATYLDLRVPERVAAGGLGPVEQEPEQPVTPTLKLRLRVGPLSTRSRDLGGLQDTLRSYHRVDRNAETSVTCENPNHVERRGTLDSY